jgi:UDP-N-acetylglucosamine 4-epimerase
MIKFPKNTKFLITGGAGFIGSNLAEHLLKQGYYVRVIDNFSTGKKSNIETFLTLPNFHLIEADIRDLEKCQEACKGIDYVLHQAALGSVPRSIKDPLTSNEVNVSGFLNMMIAARDQQVKRFVYASSSSVYGDEATLPKTEGKEGNLLSPYAITKHVNELYAKIFSSLYGLETIGLRYFNVFGKRQDPESEYAAVIPLFVRAILRNETPIIHGDGYQTRDFTYIDNVIQANLLACLAPKEASKEVFNIACGEQVAVIDMYDTIAKLMDKHVKPINVSPRSGDIRHSLADISKAHRLLGYTPEYDFLQGIKLTLSWYISYFS